ncbi:MAG: helix-turn-helix domain-containing protein [Acidobacteria bacterium]|nr:helix-turn-helix domain-containing protein [Acidobacteriota bacterium]
MTGRKPLDYKLRDADRQYLNELVRDGSLPQRVAMRARVLLALDRGERIVEILHWLGVGRMTVSDLWQRYQQRGLNAIYDAERSGRPPTFFPPGARRHRARRLH